MNGRTPQLSPARLLAGLLLPLAAYLLLRTLIGSATGALAITAAYSSSSASLTALLRGSRDGVDQRLTCI